MKSLKSLPIFFLAIACFLLAGAAAKASPLSIALAAPFQSGEGGIFAFNATVTNNSNQVVYLNSDAFNVDSPLTLDDSPFNDSYPFFLDAGDSYTGVLFNVDVPEGTPLGLYTGQFEILGGGPSDDTDVAGSADFDVSLTPEPSSFLLFGAGVLALGFLAGSRFPPGVALRHYLSSGASR
jgi:hypothetical protein